MARSQLGMLPSHYVPPKGYMPGNYPAPTLSSEGLEQLKKRVEAEELELRLEPKVGGGQGICPTCGRPYEKF